MKSNLTTLLISTIVLAGCQASNFPSNGGSGLTNSSSSTSSSGSSSSYSSTGSAACTSKGYYAVRTQCESASGDTCTATVVDYGDQDYICWKGKSSSSSSSSSSSGAGGWTTGEWTSCDNGYQSREVYCSSGSCTGTRPISTQKCTGTLYNGLHTDAQCESLYTETQDANGQYSTTWGSVKNVNGVRICAIPVRYTEASARVTGCPSGWTPYKNGNIHYTITSEVFAQEAVSGSCKKFQTHSTGGHTTMAAVPRDDESLILCTDRKCALGSFFNYTCKSTNLFISNLKAVGCF